MTPREYLLKRGWIELSENNWRPPVSVLESIIHEPLSFNEAIHLEEISMGEHIGLIIDEWVDMEKQRKQEKMEPPR